MQIYIQFSSIPLSLARALPVAAIFMQEEAAMTATTHFASRVGSSGWFRVTGVSERQPCNCLHSKVKLRKIGDLERDGAQAEPKVWGESWIGWEQNVMGGSFDGTK